MESISERNAAQVRGIDSEGIRRQVEAYLSAWRLPESWVKEVAEDLAGSGALDEKTAIREAEKRICQRLGVSAEELSCDQRVALLCSGVTGHWERESVSEIYAHGLEKVERTKQPSRPLQSYLTNMDTSLPSLPSLRMIAGWFALASSLILAFIFTH